MKLKILFVDDDPNLLAAFQRNLRNRFLFDTAVGGQEALERIRTHGPYAVLVVDMRMPFMDGVEFLERAKAVAPDAVRIMLTGNADQQTAVEAVNRGQVFRFLNKPCPSETLVPTLETALKHFEMQLMERELLEGTLTGCVKILSEVLGMVAPDALDRGLRLRDSMRRFASAANAVPIWELEIAALLSSVGYTSLPIPLLQKVRMGSLLSADEERIVRRVPQVGHDLLVGIPRLSEVARIILYQNKAYNGDGFPFDDCLGEKLPRGARMLKILVDRFQLETRGADWQNARETMRGRTGVYDPQMLLLCFDCIDSVLTLAGSGEHFARAYNVKDLKAGMAVVSDILTSDGVLLLGRGSRLTPMVIQRLRNYEELHNLQHPLIMHDCAGAEAVSRLGVEPLAQCG
jgi:response regulator RpfG family c-di-GMP phosphodiesterase